MTKLIRTRSLGQMALLLCCSSISLLAHAEVRTDGTAGKILSFSGQFSIPQSLGTIKGGNLFHSFSVFNVNAGEQATFVTTSPLQNVIARVTGASPSNINGLLQLQAAPGSQPNFYLINPAGIVVGAGAVIDVPAGLHLSTANSIKFADGRYNADLKQSSTFSASAPEAFGFLGTTTADLVFKNRASITPVKDRTISLVAANLAIEDAIIKTDGGDIKVLAVGNKPGDIALVGALPSLTGRIDLFDGGTIDASGFGTNRGGNIGLSGGDITIGSKEIFGTQGLFSNANRDGAAAGNIDVLASGTLQILNGNSITSSTFGDQRAGLIKVHARNLVIDGFQSTGTGVRSNAESGTGDGGQVELKVDDQLTILNAGAIVTSTFSRGKAGSVFIETNKALFDGGDGVLTGVFSDANGTSMNAPNAGQITLLVGDQLKLRYGGQVSASSYSSGSIFVEAVDAGAGGTILIKAKDISIDGAGNDRTGIRSFTASNGNAGNIVVTASGHIAIVDGGKISTESNYYGNAGSIKIDAASLNIDGKDKGNAGIFSTAGTQGRGRVAGSIAVKVNGDLVILNGGKISSATNSYGLSSAGAVVVNANNIEIKGGGLANNVSTGIFSTAHLNDHDTYSTGDAGSVEVTALNKLILSNGAGISSSSYFSGKAGSVAINAAQIEINDGASIKSEAGAQSAGQTGNLLVRASQSLSLDHGLLSIENSANSKNPSALRPSLLAVFSPKIFLNNAQIRASSTGNVAASNIDIHFSDRLTANFNENFSDSLPVDPRVILTSAVNGNGGSINIEGGGALILNHSQVTTSVTGLSNGNGGDITISAPLLVLNTGFIQANTAAPLAQGGAIGIHVDAALYSGNNLTVGGAPLAFNSQRFAFNAIQAAAPDGVSGVIQISSPPIDLSGSLANLSTQLFDFGDLSLDLCQIGAKSSFTQLGRGGLLASSTSLLRP